MARSHFQMKLTIWDDDDFLDLTPLEQHLYVVLNSHRSLSNCGVADWRPNRLVTRARTWTEEQARDAAAVLIERLFVLVDEDTEEVLVRSWVRHDGLMKQPKMATAMAAAYGEVASRALRGVIIHELLRLREEEPDLKGWGSEKALELLSKPSVDPSTYPLGKGLVRGSVYPSVKGKPTPIGKGPVKGSPTPSPTPAPSPAPYESLRDSRAVSAQDVVAVWVDACTANGVSPSKSQVGQVGKMAKELLASNEPMRVLEAARAAASKGFASIDRELTTLAGRPGNGVVKRDPKSGMIVER